MDFTAIKYSGQGSFKVKKGTIDKLLFLLKTIGIYPLQVSMMLSPTLDLYILSNGYIAHLHSDIEIGRRV